MARIKSKNTKPEILVRRLAHSLGYRFRLYRADLPGKPDLIFPGRAAAIFVHGCFWHQHNAPNCADGRMPKSKQDYWTPKLRRNVARDAENIAALRELGWRSLVVWECEIKNTKKLASKLNRFLRRD